MIAIITRMLQIMIINIIFLLLLFVLLTSHNNLNLFSSDEMVIKLLDSEIIFSLKEHSLSILSFIVHLIILYHSFLYHIQLYIVFLHFQNRLTIINLKLLIINNYIL